MDNPTPALPHEAAIRLGFFAGVLVLMALWEIVAPRRDLSVSKAVRWRGNLALVVLNTVALRVLLPVTAVIVAQWCSQNDVGLLQRVELPAIVAVLVAVLLLDLAIYAQHVVFHRVPVLWRLHRVHHTDLDFDVTTAVRFHPIEIVLSMGIKMAVVLLIGAPPVAVVVFEVLLNATALFNHGNVRLARGLDRVLRLALVTPEMHRVHHSVLREETDSNFGFNLPWWDRLFGTYRDQPARGHEGMEIGLSRYRGSGPLRLGWLLANPFTSSPTSSSGRDSAGEQDPAP